MRQFVVPQFIDVENKIIGPITVRQFALILIALLVSIIFYRFVDFTLFLVIAAVIFALAGIFAFVKINGRPVHYLILNLLQTITRPRLRIWNKNFSDMEIKNRIKNKKNKKEIVINEVKRIKKSRLSDLSLLVDTGGKYIPEDNQL